MSIHPHQRKARGGTEATINIRNLRLRTFIGFNPEERAKQDEVDGALDYKILTKRVIRHVEDGRFLLLERLVADVLDLCSEHPSIVHSRVTIDKPHALRFADSVSLTLEYRADEANGLRFLEKVS